MSIFNTIGSSTATHYFKQSQLDHARGIKRLSSGSKHSTPSSDGGALSVSLSLNSSKSQLKSIEGSIQNAIAYLEVQDGLMETAGKIFLRIQELYGLFQSDPLKTEGGSEQSLYDAEFNDLQEQLNQILGTSFNGNDLFVESTDGDGEEIAIRVSPDGNQEISIKRQDLDYSLGGVLWFPESLNDIDEIDLEIDMEDFSAIRMENASSRKQLSIIAESLSRQKVSTSRALERVDSIDVAFELASLAKNSILLNSSASMLAQANFSTDRVEALLGI
jgi:flagellin-like hook-associated protein FlgL